MKKAFTMIELIFVIVIIGILATVAISKLAATRDDAKIAEIITNSRTALGDLTAYYTSQGSTNWTDVNGTMANATNVAFLSSSCEAIDTNASEISPNTFYLCDADQPCLTFTTTDVGTLEISSASGISPVCSGAQNNPTIQNIMTVHRFGAALVQR